MKKNKINLKQNEMDYVKANRRGSREAELENSTGWTSRNRVHKSKKIYSRKGKMGRNFNNDYGTHFSFRIW